MTDTFPPRPGALPVTEIKQGEVRTETEPESQGPAAMSWPKEENHLIVGSDIHLCGDISGCDLIRVAGTIEASFNGQRLEVLEGGVYKGSARVETAEIMGSAEGNIAVTSKLRIHSGASLRGKVRYGAIEVHGGAEIVGNFEAVEKKPVPAQQAIISNVEEIDPAANDSGDARPLYPSPDEGS